MFSHLGGIHVQGVHTDPFIGVFEDGYNLGKNRSPNDVRNDDDTHTQSPVSFASNQGMGVL